MGLSAKFFGVNYHFKRKGKFILLVHTSHNVGRCCLGHHWRAGAPPWLPHWTRVRWAQLSSAAWPCTSCSIPSKKANKPCNTEFKKKNCQHNAVPTLPLVALCGNIHKKMRNLQKLMIRWIFLTGNHLGQHLRHHLSVPAHNVELTAQLANLINYIVLYH